MKHIKLIALLLVTGASRTHAGCGDFFRRWGPNGPIIIMPLSLQNNDDLRGQESPRREKHSKRIKRRDKHKKDTKKTRS